MMLSEWLDLAERGLEIVGSAGGVLAGAAVIIFRSTFLTRREAERLKEEREKDQRALQQRIEASEMEIAVITERLRDAPTHKDIERVMDRIAGVESGVREMSAAVEGLRQVMERIEKPLDVLLEHHLKGSRS